MNFEDIRLLQSIQGYPSVSILSPTHRTYPENQQDQIRLKNLVKETVNRLLSEFSKREIDSLLRRLEEITTQIDYRNMLDGLAIFVNRDFARLDYLPFELKERVEIGQSFTTRDLVFAINRTPRYWVLALSEQPTRLFEAVRDFLVETSQFGFPLTHQGPGGSEPLPGGFGIRRSAHRDERHRQFFRRIDSALSEALAADPLPMILVGIDRYLAFFREVTRHPNTIAGTLSGSHDKTSPHELAKLVWPIARESIFEKRKSDALNALNNVRGTGKIAAGVDEVWFMANQGRGDILLVEENFHFPALKDPSGLHLLPAEHPDAPGVLADAVDDIIELVLEKGGSVTFVDPGALEEDQRIAMTLRY